MPELATMPQVTTVPIDGQQMARIFADLRLLSASAEEDHVVWRFTGGVTLYLPDSTGTFELAVEPAVRRG